MSTIKNWRRRLSNVLDPIGFANRTKSLAERERLLKIKEHNLMANEKGLFKSDLWANLAIGDYNPDKIGIPTYKKMVNYDAQIISGLDILQMAINVPWKIEHPKKEVVDFITWSLKRLTNPTFEENVIQIMSAIWAGFSTTETVWEYIQDQHKYALRQELGLKTFDPESITFKSRRTGQLERLYQTIDNQEVDLVIDKMLIYTWNKRWGNYYGNSLLKAIYKNWFIKDNMLKFANIAFERFGSPILLGITKDVKSMDEIEDVLTHLYARSVGVIRKVSDKDPTDIKILESKRTSMPFMEYIEYHNKQILARMLIGEPLLKGGGGVYGPRVPYSILNTRLGGIRSGISGALNKLMYIFTHVNFETDEAAKIVFEPVDQEELEQNTDEAMTAKPDLDKELTNNKKKTQAEERAEREKNNRNGGTE